VLESNSVANFHSLSCQACVTSSVEGVSGANRSPLLSVGDSILKPSLLPLSKLVQLNILIFSNTHYMPTCIATLAINNCSAIPFHLKDELQLDRVSALDWKQLQRICRRLNELTTPLLFQKVYFELCGRGCDSQHNISCNRSLSTCVQTLILRRFRGYREFPAFNTWVARTHQPGDPSNELALPIYTSHYNDRQISYVLLPYTKWVALLNNEKNALYHRYEVERKQAQKEVQDITNTLMWRLGLFYLLYTP